MEVLAEDKKDIVREEYDFYRKIRSEIPTAFPFWPLGFAQEGDDWMSLGLKMEKKDLLAVWRIKGEDTCELPLAKYKGKNIDVKVAFPYDDIACKAKWDAENGIIKVTLPEKKMARILEVTLCK